MAESSELTREAFLFLAAAVGLDVSGSHGEELFPIVRNTLAGLESLKDIDVSGAEPDMVFIPPRD